MNNFLNISVCPATLEKGFNTYSPKALKELFNGENVSPILPFTSPQSSDAQKRIFLENKKRISISGVQEKYSLKLVGNQLELTEKGGEYILKPIPTDLLNVQQVPANEHLTMQMAAQIFKLNVAQNAMIFFADGQPAYITKRFDVKADGSRCLKEDFASLAQVSSQNVGNDFKYNYSYFRMSELIDAYFPANIKAKEDFFQLVVFNYLFSNGDAHLKNFSRIDCNNKGDAFLSPAYDLVNTRLHIDDADMALHDGLYDKDYNYPSFATLGYYAFDDFYEFGIKMGLVSVRIKRFINHFLNKTEAVHSLIARSFLNDESKAKYLSTYADKHTRLSNSVSGINK